MHSTVVASSHHIQLRREARAHGVRFTGVEITILALLTAVVIAAAVVPAVLRAQGQPARTTMLKVGEHDTLWEIAAAHPVDGMTTQQTVDLIQQLNDTPEGRLVAGQLLVIPAGPEGTATLASR